MLLTFRLLQCFHPGCGAAGFYPSSVAFVANFPLRGNERQKEPCGALFVPIPPPPETNYKGEKGGQASLKPDRTGKDGYMLTHTGRLPAVLLFPRAAGLQADHLGGRRYGRLSSRRQQRCFAFAPPSTSITNNERAVALPRSSPRTSLVHGRLSAPKLPNARTADRRPGISDNLRAALAQLTYDTGR